MVFQHHWPLSRYIYIEVMRTHIMGSICRPLPWHQLSSPCYCFWKMNIDWAAVTALVAVFLSLPQCHGGRETLAPNNRPVRTPLYSGDIEQVSFCPLLLWKIGSWTTKGFFQQLSQDRHEVPCDNGALRQSLLFCCDELWVCT